MSGKEVIRTRFGDEMKWLAVRNRIEGVRPFEQPTCSEDTCLDV